MLKYLVKNRYKPVNTVSHRRDIVIHSMHSKVLVTLRQKKLIMDIEDDQEDYESILRRVDIEQFSYN